MNKKNIEAIYQLSPVQQGMLFDTLTAPNSGVHIEQITCKIQGNLELNAFEKALQRVVDRHPILRTCFVWKEQDEPLQIVLRQVQLSPEKKDWCQLSYQQQQEQLKTFLEAERQQGFELTRPPLIRTTIIHLNENEYLFIWSYHHILLDGWSIPLIFKEVFAFYEAFRRGENLHLEQPRPYRDYIVWLKNQDLSKAETFWRETLQGFTKPTALGKVEDKFSPINNQQFTIKKE